MGTVQPGFVRSVQSYGCFVEFLHQLSGLAHLKYLTDQFVPQASGVYQETQTVLAKVSEICILNGTLDPRGYIALGLSYGI